MELLIAHCLQEFQASGRELASLGGSPFASTSDRHGVLERTLGLMFEHAGFVYEAKGLFNFKRKFAPIWEPQYLLYPHGFDAPRVALALGLTYR